MRILIIVFIILVSCFCGCSNIKYNAQNIDEFDTIETEDNYKSEYSEKLPIYADKIEDGIYNVNVESSSSMFRIVDAKLNVQNNNMYAVITLSGKGYAYLFMGKGEQALKASENDYINYVENDEGMYTYTVPVEALNVDIDCAAWSIKKEKWYDRVIVFKPDLYKTLSDGEYSIDVSLTGGSGKAKILSPTCIVVKNNSVTAEIKFESPYYDYIIFEDKKYKSISNNGFSVFEIPFGNIYNDINITANTTAMSKPYNIDYVLSFDLNSVKAME